MHHLDKTGFAFDVATVSGNPVKFEYWAMPSELTLTVLGTSSIL